MFGVEMYQQYIIYTYLYIKNIYISGYQIRYCADGSKCAKGDKLYIGSVCRGRHELYCIKCVRCVVCATFLLQEVELRCEKGIYMLRNCRYHICKW